MLKIDLNDGTWPVNSFMLVEVARSFRVSCIAQARAAIAKAQGTLEGETK